MRLFSISIGVVLLILLVVGGIYYFQTQHSGNLIGNYHEPATNLTKPGEYVNSEFGFVITYAPMTKTYMASCESFKSGKNEPTEVGVFETSGAVYIANKETVEIRNKEDPSGDFGYDFETCKEVPTTVSLIKTGFPNGLPEKYGDRTYPVAMKFSFGKVANDKELLKFGEKGLGGVKDCQIASKKFVKGSKDSYEIRLQGQGAAGETGGSCWLNADYQFLYSPTTKTAVVSSGYQNCIFGVEKMCVPQVKLLE